MAKRPTLRDLLADPSADNKALTTAAAREYRQIADEADRLLGIHYTLPAARAAHLAAFMAKVERGHAHPTRGDLWRAEEFLQRRSDILRLQGKADVPG